jgi:two-component sensor histidine kinase
MRPRGKAATEKAVPSLNDELRSAGENLVGNDEVLRTVLAGCGDCIKILDLDGRLQFMSEGGKRVMEVEDFGQLKGCPWPDFWPGAGNKDARAAVLAARFGETRRFRGPANTAKGNPRHWDVEVSPIFGADGKPEYLLSISRDITVQVEAEEKLRESARQQRWLSQELAHRLKNTLTLIIAIANQTLRGKSLEDPRKALIARVMALDATQDILTESTWKTAPITAIIERALGPHQTSEARFSIAGPLVNLGSNPALMLALAINELATNAAKYGALSRDNGIVDIRWAVEQADGAPTFALTWQERGGPPVTPPTRNGFGSRLIQHYLAESFKGRVTLDYNADGVRFRLSAPVENLEPPEPTRPSNSHQELEDAAARI